MRRALLVIAVATSVVDAGPRPSPLGAWAFEARAGLYPACGTPARCDPARSKVLEEVKSLVVDRPRADTALVNRRFWRIAADRTNDEILFVETPASSEGWFELGFHTDQGVGADADALLRYVEYDGSGDAICGDTKIFFGKRQH
jgi:hypothetical protein